MQAQPLSLPRVPEPTYGERLKGKVVVITGAAQGIGEAIVACFQAQQAQLVIGDILGDKVEAVAAHWRERGAQIHALPIDITAKEQWQALVNLAIERFGRVDVLVNCAGVNVFRDPLEMSDEDWRRCFAIDLDGAWFLASEARLRGCSSFVYSSGRIFRLKSSRWMSKLGLVQGSPAASRSPQRA